jgi:hypothetical protein
MADKGTAQAFKVNESGTATGLTFKDGRRINFDPPVLLEVGFKYAVDLDTGDLWQVFDGGYMECLARAKEWLTKSSTV